MSTRLLEVEDLQIQFATKMGTSRVVDGVSFHVDEGETIGIVGESGSGKSMTALGILRLIPPPGKIVSGSVKLNGEELTTLSPKAMREVRGRQISMILQDPMTALNPSFTVGSQVGEAIQIADGITGKPLLRRVIDMLKRVHIPAAERRAQDYPHQMSGGMRQRVAGAISISTSPRVLICDEPTTALDVTIQAQYLDLLREIQKTTHVALIFITHDMGIVAKICNRVAVMYAGRIVESGSTRDVFFNPSHPYTIALLRCLPSIEGIERLESIDGLPPSPAEFPPGCRFAPRCPKAQAVCQTTYPPIAKMAEGHWAACHFPGDWHE